MVALLDVNALIALFDPMHVHHQVAHRWFGRNKRAGWASCPLTENGVVRVLSNPAYPGRRTTVRDARARLAQFRNGGRHEFWPDSISICDESLFRIDRILGHRQLTDAYLLALAVKNEGRVATLDAGMPLQCVTGASENNVALMSA